VDSPLLTLLFPHLEGLDVAEVDRGGGQVAVSAATTTAKAPCPSCGVVSEHLHSRYQRTLTDVGPALSQMRIGLTVKRFRCRNAACERATFAEQVEGLTGRYRRTTPSAQEVIDRLGTALAGRAGARIAAMLSEDRLADQGRRHRLHVRHGRRDPQRPPVVPLDLAGRKAMVEQGSAQRQVEYTGGTVHELTDDTPGIQREFSDFYRTARGELTPKGGSSEHTTHPTLTSNLKFLNFYPFNDIETISPRPMLFITGDRAHSIQFSQEAYEKVGEPKELLVVPEAGHVDLYDRVTLIPFDRLTSYFKEHLG
jgi:hypothetical protein